MFGTTKEVDDAMHRIVLSAASLLDPAECESSADVLVLTPALTLAAHDRAAGIIRTVLTSTTGCARRWRDPVRGKTRHHRASTKGPHRRGSDGYRIVPAELGGRARLAPMKELAR